VDNTTVGNYRKLFGLSGNLPAEIIDGNDPGSDGDGAGGEADLDVEVSGATAPDAQIYLYVSGDTGVTSGLYTAAMRAVDDDTAGILSLSYRICENDLGLFGNLLFQTLWSQAAAQGQSVFVASGDSGSAGCDNGASQASGGISVNGFGSTPYNTSVGGTDFYYSAPLGVLRPVVASRIREPWQNLPTFISIRNTRSSMEPATLRNLSAGSPLWARSPSQ
jgi:subtilase family serine protease